MKRRLPAASIVRRALGRCARLGCVAGLLAAVGTVAVAQQGWEPTVTAEPAGVRLGARTAGPPAPKYKAAQAMTPGPPAAAASVASDAKAVADEAAAPLPPRKDASTTAAGEYCVNIVDAAADARVAWQKKMLADAGDEIAKRIALLEEKTAEYRKWLARRDEFSKKANETVLRIYARMRPDAAAAQLAGLDEETAAAVITKLDPRLASLILNDMEPGYAARLTATISGAAKVLPAAHKDGKAGVGTK